jgi:putative tricarboxylic transport membrane protein
MRAVGITAPERIKGIDVPTLKELGIPVEIGNWRGVYGAPGITAEQRKALVEMVTKATQHKSWAEALEKNGWTPALLTGDAFAQFVERDTAQLRETMTRAGMVG